MLFYLKLLGSMILGLTLITSVGPHYGGIEDYGWIESESQGNPLFGAPEIASGHGKVRLLYKEWEEATGYVYIPRNQFRSPSCVGQATGSGLDFRMATQSLEGPYLVPQWTADASSIYGLSRVEIGGTDWINGSKVRWAMEAMSEYGLLYRKNYLYAGYDLTKYSPMKSRSWGRNGLPSVLEEIAKTTPLVEYYKVRNYQEVRDAIVAGYSVVVGSNVGFSRRTIFSFGQVRATRDRDGFLRARGTWRHAMVFIGVDDKSRRKGVCCLNSWGKSWVIGPRKLDQPPGSFWIGSQTVTRMAKQGGAYAIVRVKSPLNYELTK